MNTNRHSLPLPPEPARSSRHPSEFRRLAVLLGVFASAGVSWASTSYGSLNNFDVVNDTGDKCYGFEIELEDIHSTDITYTYDYNHYGTPRISQDDSDPLHPRVRIRYSGQPGPDGQFQAFTNPQDPANPLAPTDGHAFTNPGVNLGGEHFGAGFSVNPSAVRYHWLVADPTKPGALILGPAVTISTPSFAYVPAVVGGGGARADVRMEPPEDERPAADQYGVAVWVKTFKTVQRSGKHLRLEELVTDDEKVAGREDWSGGEAPETEIEWRVFQKRPAKKADGENLEAADDLPNGDEMVTRRYEFYSYVGETDPEDGEALCEDPAKCPDAVGGYIGAQMAGFNVEAPLGLIEHVQDCGLLEESVPRSVVAGGNTPYAVQITSGALPPGLQLDAVTGVLSGAPTASGAFTFTVKAQDADGTEVSREFSLAVPAPLSARLTGGQLKLTWGGAANLRLEQSDSLLALVWTEVPDSLGRSEMELPLGGERSFFRVARP